MTHSPRMAVDVSTKRGGRFFGQVGMAVLLLLLLSGCSQESSSQTMSRTAILEGAESMLAGCTAGLDTNGDIGEAGLVAAGWKVTKRTRSEFVMENNVGSVRESAQPLNAPSTLRSKREYEWTNWIHPGSTAQLDVERHGGAVSERIQTECRIGFLGSERETAEDVRALLVRKYGKPARTGLRSSGGDFLAPKFESHYQYWRLPHHDLFWVSADPTDVSLEVTAMPDGVMRFEQADDELRAINGIK